MRSVLGMHNMCWKKSVCYFTPCMLYLLIIKRHQVASGLVIILVIGYRCWSDETVKDDIEPTVTFLMCLNNMTIWKVHWWKSCSNTLYLFFTTTLANSTMSLTDLYLKKSNSVFMHTYGCMSRFKANSSNSHNWWKIVVITERHSFQCNSSSSITQFEPNKTRHPLQFPVTGDTAVQHVTL